VEAIFARRFTARLLTRQPIKLMMPATTPKFNCTVGIQRRLARVWYLPGQSGYERRFWRYAGSDIPTEVETKLVHDISDGMHAARLCTRLILTLPAVWQAFSAGLTGRLTASHHQSVQQPAPDMCVTAHAPDGVIEGLEMPDKKFILSVQWHPEDLYDKRSRCAACFARSSNSEWSSRLKSAFLDSGIGGLSVLREIHHLLPNHPTVYFADQAHLPYGPRSVAEIRVFVEAISQFLLEQGAVMIVIACNTASAASLLYLREKLPHIRCWMEQP